MDLPEKIKTPKIFIFFISLMVGAAVFSNWYHYVAKENYYFIVEAPCDISKESCSFRDCENSPDLCPPNNLSYFKRWNVAAKDFALCTDNSCERQCRNNTIQCQTVTCSADEGVECLPQNQNN